MVKRMMRTYGLLVIVFLLLCLRLAHITIDNDVLAVGQTQNRRTLTVATTRGTIYDRNMQPLVNAENQYYAVLSPQQRLLEEIRTKTEADEYQRVVTELSKQAPAVARLSEPAAITDGLYQFMAPIRYGSYCPSTHLIGYLNGSGAGAFGLEKAYNQRLNRFAGSIQVRYSMNGLGEYMDNEEAPHITNTTKNSAGGIQLTIDRSIQEMVDAVASQYMEKGSVVVLDVDSGGILAATSLPSFHPNAIDDSVKADDGSLVNRLFSLYDCGSVFKIVTAAAALESGISVDQHYDCPGAITVGETVFHCHLRTGHRMLDMQDAFAQSCNVYFIQLAQQIGAQTILDMAEQLGLTEPIVLADGMEAPASVLPDEVDLSADAAVANLSFGQGKLMVTPLHVAQFTAMIAANGQLKTPYLVESYVDKGGGIQPLENREGEGVLSLYTVLRLQEMMQRVVTDGTGKRAKPENVDAAGKTGTAQTGQFNNGKPVVQNWFTGYFPAQNPAYAITIVAEDSHNYVSDAIGLFCEISNKLS